MKDVKDILNEAQEKMDMAIMYLEETLAHIRAGKADVRLLDGIRVDSYGSMVPINNVAAVTTPDARSIAIKPWDKSMFRVIEKAIIDSALGIMPENNGEIIRIGIPPLTEERRKQLAKQCKGEGETAKVSVRNARRDAIDQLKKAVKEGLAEDAQKGGEEKLQKIHDKYIKQIDDMLVAKDKEIMTVYISEDGEWKIENEAFQFSIPNYPFSIINSPFMKGLVIKNTGSWYLVKTEDGRCIECKIKGNFRLKGIRSTNPVAVGDYVQIILNQEGTAFISEIEDRRNYIIRRASNLSKQSHIIASNLDQCMLIVTVNYPETSTTFIDRFLATAEAYRIPVKLIFNKIDAYDDDDIRYLDSLIHLYTTIGYPCFKVSATQGSGIDLLKAELSGRITLLSGHSGVGKSTLINAILPDAAARTGEISAAHNKGMHTTTFSEMFALEGGGYLIDTPGIKGFGTFDMEEEEIGHYFPEIFKTSAECRYGNCTHRHEPGCAVRRAVEEHYISESRYQSYLSMLEDKEEGKYRTGY